VRTPELRHRDHRKLAARWPRRVTLLRPGGCAPTRAAAHVLRHGYSQTFSLLLPVAYALRARRFQSVPDTKIQSGTRCRHVGLVCRSGPTESVIPGRPSIELDAMGAGCRFMNCGCPSDGRGPGLGASQQDDAGLPCPVLGRAAGTRGAYLSSRVTFSPSLSFAQTGRVAPFTAASVPND
jgi:hypothetical protein